ncbi:hypothetical protein GWG65_37650 [Bradyrhizobium sp. CSA207]|uniref:hypothetical protein n=1 Tax=Bradyrhizobium sp. CSA207 TaxID=2698826 RepID=UPI0023B1B4B4|nr:hypothetical protein [Bradyrhizobium sp. CSA207]MDE5446962.1 hypothetical protein [Bradyrhizobium sp. CSA207]
MAEDEVVEAITKVMDALSPLDAEAREHVLEFVLKRMGISVVKSAGSLAATPAYAAPPPVTPSSGMDIRTFASEKAPKTLNEKVAVMAFFLANLAPPDERRDFITSEDIKPYFIQADFELPTGPANMTLTNAKNAGYLNALERGQYKLNSVGHNLVAHKLPKREGASGSPRKTAKKTTKKAKR